ncbi:hypothetical protein BMS3Abin06_00707 [bacterium BMS3Abin06]|nr:hypothetical protein BMS3Abin06_00707 [bacterium BMS3Abin06]
MAAYKEELTEDFFTELIPDDDYYNSLQVAYDPRLPAPVVMLSHLTH